jgi:arylsulfatase A-like enzyme
VRRHEGVATDRYKLIRFYGPGMPNGEEWELYDLKTDPNEMNSVHDDPAQAQRVEELKAELQRLRRHYRVPDDHR